MARTLLLLTVAAACCTCVNCRSVGPREVTWYEAVAREAAATSSAAAEGDEDPAWDFDPAIMPTREEALRLLLQTRTFTDVAIYAEGIAPIQLKSFGVLLRQEEAAHVFRVLLRDARPAGQMFALCGLHLVDRPYFERAVRRFKDDGRTVTYHFGCVRSPATVARLVEKPGPVIRLGRGVTARPDFHVEFGGRPEYLDISGGGWPEVFRTAIVRMNANGEIEDGESDEAPLGRAESAGQEPLFGR